MDLKRLLLDTETELSNLMDFVKISYADGEINERTASQILTKIKEVNEKIINSL